MVSKKQFFMALLAVMLTLSACAKPTAGTPAPVFLPVVEATENVVTLPTSSPIPPTSAPLPTATSLPTTTPQPTATPSPSPTAASQPFAGFGEYFRFYRVWKASETSTAFYFIHAGEQHYPLFGLVDGSDPLQCDADLANPIHMICLSENNLLDRPSMEVELFADPARTQSVWKKSVVLNPGEATIFHNQYNCPSRGQNVHCEEEYRLYESGCYYGVSCYDACGPYYSRDNIPDGIQGPWVPTGPCN